MTGAERIAVTSSRQATHEVTVSTREADLRGLARRGFATGAGLAASGLLTFALSVMVSRELGPRDTGVFYVAVAAFSNLTTVGQLGADIGLLRWIPMRLAQGEGSLVRADLKTALVPVVLGSSVGAAALAIAGVALWRSSHSHEPRSEPGFSRPRGRARDGERPRYRRDQGLRNDASLRLPRDTS